MSKKDRFLTVRFGPKMYEALQQLAQKKGQTLSNLIRDKARMMIADDENST